MASVAQSRAKLSKESTYSVQRASAPSFQLHLFFFSSLPPFPLLALATHALSLSLSTFRSTAIPRYVPAIPVLSFFTAFFSLSSFFAFNPRAFHYIRTACDCRKTDRTDRPILYRRSKRATLEQRRTRISGNQDHLFFFRCQKSKLAQF